MIPDRLAYQKLLKEALLLEIDRNQEHFKGRDILSIYFGGGTPSLFTSIDEILRQLPAASEITIEANPEDASLERFAYFRSLGINRLSLGIQSLDARSLESLERIHSANKAREAIFLAKEAGFDNVSIDLMIDLPNQTEKSLQHTLAQLPGLPITHLSLYNLTVEPHTPFYKRKVQTPPPELSLKLLELAIESVENIGLKRYEISAFAKPGFESRHNLGYWTGREFLGLGPSACSYLHQERFQNIANLHRYARALKSNVSPVDFRERLPYPKNVNELLAIRLRLVEGVSLEEFECPEETLQVLERLRSLGLIEKKNKQMILTKRGKLFYDTVASEII